MHIVLANSAEVEKLVDSSGFQGQLSKACFEISPTPALSLSPQDRHIHLVF